MALVHFRLAQFPRTFSSALVAAPAGAVSGCWVGTGVLFRARGRADVWAAMQVVGQLFVGQPLFVLRLVAEHEP